ncbi:class I SAM-dependent DNA methyltransferase [Azotobacter beijerinckii]|uniref:class I SAM-dependent DNA methyltransferase n=1 Tax=Azotobacter beijerinckii TaxID=170623 RepID=UPI002953EA38|nr:class I SAM-dependent DNA methyltransferase [Azotobacter beijerinckii]MDV7211336.1 class I SAM-dependent DNA methyltransferase [Azotobacter beijerinckii]
MTDQATLRTAILAAVPNDGGTIGNQSLLEHLHKQFPQLNEEDFWAVRDDLIDAGQLAKGRGRGGSVRRADEVPQIQLDAFSLAEQALNEARVRFTPSQAPVAEAKGLDKAPDVPEQPTKKSRGKAAASSQTSTTLQDLEKTLWATADKLRANMDAAEYKHIVLGLIFLKYISDSFAGRCAELERRFLDEGDDYYLGDDDPELLAAELEVRDYYKEINVFWVPEAARWEAIRAAAKQVDIGKRIDDALSAIEAENPSLKNILDKRYARAQLPDGKLGELVDLISTIGFGSDANQARDLLGQVYEYFLGQFASAEGKKGGQFYTPASIVKTLVAVLNPHHGKVYDPCCGSGGMFVQSEKFIEAHGGKLGDVSIYGQESNPTTWRLAAMNLAIRGIDFNLGKEPADTFVRNQHADLRADFILANPPFNVSDWWHGSLEGDPRWVYGTPPTGNANYAWLQHMLHHLKPSGRAGIVLANGSMSTSQNSEGEIRRAMVEADVVEVMVALPGQLFFNTQIPACLWFLAKQKTARPGEVLFIDARKLGTPVSRVQIELTDAEIERIAQTVAAWRGEALDEGGEVGEYADVPGFCRSVTLAEITEHSHVLTPGRYVGAEQVEDDDEAFADKMQRLTTKLGEQMANGEELDHLIRQKLGGLGYEF